jgi:nitrogen regulatory protein PII
LLWEQQGTHEKDRSHHQAVKLDEVKEALQEIGLEGITVNRGQGFGAEGATRALSGRRIRRRLPAQGQVGS